MKTMIWGLVLGCCVVAPGCLSTQQARPAGEPVVLGPDPYWAKLRTVQVASPARRDLRQELEKRFAGGSDGETLYQDYFAKARQEKDIDSLFGAALCAHQILSSGTASYRERMKRADAVHDLMDETPHLPMDYEFVRARFLLQSQESWLNSARELVKVGPMLLQHRPDDWDVEYRYASVLIHGGTDARRLRSYVTRLQQKYPEKKEQMKSLMSSLYMVLANRKADPMARDIEIRLYQEMLRDNRLKKETPRAQEVEENIRYLLKAALELKTSGK